MARASTVRVNADDVPPLGPFSAPQDDAASWGDIVIISLLAIGVSLAGLTAVAAAISGAVL